MEHGLGRLGRAMLTLIASVTLCLGIAAICAYGQQSSVLAQVEVVRQGGAERRNADKNFGDVVVWLVPMEAPPSDPVSTASVPQIVQRNKTFEPHVLAVRVGSGVQFPNKDPFLHNVFSLFDGKRFDLGFYEAGSSRTVRFDRAGVSFLFCNIHPEMSAVIVVLPAPYFDVSDRQGRVTLAHVSNGRYRMEVWYERSTAEELQNLARPVTVTDQNRTLGTIRVAENPSFALTHKNKYGQDYVPAATGISY
jgi:plastocyanin